MNKQVIAVISVIAFLVLGSGLYVLLSREPEEASPTTQSTSTTPPTLSTTSKQAEPATTQSGAYVAYSDDAFTATSGTRLLFFHAPWCPQCRDLDASISSATLPDDVTIFKVDYDSRQDLRNKYGVTIQTTVVKVDASGSKVDSYVAYDAPSYSNVQANLLQQ